MPALSARIKLTDRLLVIILFAVMGVLSVVQMLALREINDNTNRLRRAVLSERQWAEVTTVCILNVSGQVNFGQIPYTPEAIQTAVSECIIQEGRKRGIPGSDEPITTTTLPNTPTSSFSSTTTATITLGE